MQSAQVAAAVPLPLKVPGSQRQEPQLSSPVPPEQAVVVGVVLAPSEAKAKLGQESPQHSSVAPLSWKSAIA